MRILKNLLKNDYVIRTEMDFPKKGIEFIDINSLIMNDEALKEIFALFVKEVKDKDIDYIIAPEARGFIFGPTVAYKIGAGCVPVRKKGKLPPTTVECSFEYEKEYGKDYMELPKLVNESYKGKKFYIIDDIYATGNTMKVIKEAIESLGGIVVGEGVVMNIVELNDNKSLFSLIDVNEE
jgi:adenine phosphoribosyltransferase